jgi:hypothetical protein
MLAPGARRLRAGGDAVGGSAAVGVGGPEMNWKPPATKVNVVTRYLTARFPGAGIRNGTDFDTMSEFFNVEQGAVRYLGAVSREVLDDFTERQIDGLLTTHDLAGRMKDAAPNRVTLTSTGVRG